MKRFFFITSIILFSNYIISQNNTLTDNRDGKEYETVKIGQQTWMAENLNFNIDKSYCYANNVANCDLYGRLYTWEAAKNVCPEGWHLPSDGEWVQLESHLGMNESELLKKDDWRGTDQGQQLIENHDLGFNILLAGYRNPPSNYFLMGMQAFFWSSTEVGGQAWFRQFMTGIPQIFRRTREKSWAMSVRCVKDE